MTALTSVDVVNRALQQIAAQSEITTLSGTSPEQIAASVLYSGVVQSVLRQSPWDAARKSILLSSSGGTAPPPWMLEYLYPTDCIQVRQVMPEAPSQYDPQPVLWAVGSAVVGSTPTKVIWTNQGSARLIYTFDAPESEWDSLLTETVVRMLASELAMSIAGRPDFAKQKLEEAGQMTQIAESRDY